MSDPAWFRRLFAAVALTTAALTTPNPSVAQESGTEQARYLERPLAADRAALLARAAEIESLLPELADRAAVFSTELEGVRVRETVGTLDSTRVGPFMVIADRLGLAVAEELTRRSWEPFRAALENDAEWLEGVRIVVDRDFPESLRDERTHVVDLDPTVMDLYDLDRNGWPVRGSIDGELNRALRGTRGLTGWLEGGGVGQVDDPVGLWTAMSTLPSPAGPACLQGSAADCIVAVGLRPTQETTSSNAIERMRAFLDLESAEATVEWMEDRARSVARWGGPGYFDVQYFDLMRDCLDDPETEVTLENSTWRCSNVLGEQNLQYLLEEFGAQPPSALKRSLLNHALAVGPPGALSRLSERDGAFDYEAMLQEVAGMALHELVDGWRAANFGENAIPRGGPSSSPAPAGLFWAGLFVTFSFLSTRRRFG